MRNKKKLLIDVSHPEETRIAVLKNDQLDSFDLETAAKQQNKGNLYLGRITRVEPSLQAAFVEYGDSRNGFLAFSEIHPDYFRLPAADGNAEAVGKGSPTQSQDEENGDQDPHPGYDRRNDLDEDTDGSDAFPVEDYTDYVQADDGDDREIVDPDDFDELAEDQENVGEVSDGSGEDEEGAAGRSSDRSGGSQGGRGPRGGRQRSRRVRNDDEVVAYRNMRQRYKIQEVIHRKQIVLVQVLKEERGGKGAALTTFISLAGRYCVLMPNTSGGGGVSRKVSSLQDRQSLRETLDLLQPPSGMSVIVRTAGAGRDPRDIERDYDYLTNLWDRIRERTLASRAPSMVYEDSNPVRKAIRDLYDPDMEEVLIHGEEAYEDAYSFMGQIMPGNEDKIRLFKPGAQGSLFRKYRIEEQLGDIHQPQIMLPSGGSIVVQQTEALVSIDVNSGKHTGERHIEETAYSTNMEASDAIAKQLRLRDLAGLVVIDFIDMEDPRNDQTVERRLRDALRSDRARIQMGKISQFGLLELSRQRLRPSVMESMSEPCPLCRGNGLVPSCISHALGLLRQLEDRMRTRSEPGNILVTATQEIIAYLLHEKQAWVSEIEKTFGHRVVFSVDPSLAIATPPFTVLHLGVDANEFREDSRDQQFERGRRDSNRGYGRGRDGGRGRGSDRGRYDDRNDRSDSYQADSRNDRNGRDDRSERNDRGYSNSRNYRGDRNHRNQSSGRVEHYDPQAGSADGEREIQAVGGDTGRSGRSGRSDRSGRGRDAGSEQETSEDRRGRDGQRRRRTHRMGESRRGGSGRSNRPQSDRRRDSSQGGKVGSGSSNLQAKDAGKKSGWLSRIFGS